jgi:hypothetical protein
MFFCVVCPFKCFCRLPVDIYQTGKVSKILLMMEKGGAPAEYKGKTLSKIQFDSNLEFAVENNDDGKLLLTILVCMKL